MNKVKLLGGVLAILVLQFILLANPALATGAMPAPQSKKPEVQKLIDQAEALVYNEISIKTLDAGIPLLEKANQLDPNNVEIMVELANFYWQRGDQMPKAKDADFDKRNVYFNKGLAYAQNSLKIKETAGGYYWYSANLASSYQNRSVVAQAGIFPTLIKNNNWIEKNDRKYFYGGGARIWSKIIAEVPSVVLKMVGQDPNEALVKLENAIKIEPRYLLNYTYKGNFLWSQGKKEEALKAWDYAIKADPNAFSGEAAKNRLAQKDAREEWKKATGKEWPQR